MELRTVLDTAFPKLETLSLSNDFGERVLPNNFVAPRLRALRLRSITISRGSLRLTGATNLLSLHLESIQVSGSLPSHHENLVECITDMPHLEDILISFQPYPSFSDTVMELPHLQVTRVMLPRLTRLIYRGFDLSDELIVPNQCPFPPLPPSKFSLSRRKLSYPPFLTCQRFSVQSRTSIFKQPCCGSPKRLSPSRITTNSHQLPCPVLHSVSMTLLTYITPLIRRYRSAVPLRLPFLHRKPCA